MEVINVWLLTKYIVIEKKNVLRLLYESKKELWEVWKNCGLFYCYNLPDIYRSARSKKKKKKKKKLKNHMEGMERLVEQIAFTFRTKMMGDI